MGCYNETCFLTNMPILSDDRAIFIPLYQKHAMPGESQPNDNFLFAGTSMVGIYNEYGIITDIEKSESAEFTYNLFKECIEKKTIKLNEGCGEKIPINNIDDLVRALERGRMVHHRSGFPFRYIMMHEGAYHSIINEIGNRLPYDKKEPYKYYVKKKFEATKENTSLLYSGDYFFRENLFMCHKWHKAVVNKEASDIVTKLTELSLFMKALNYLRKQLMPTIGKGSQCNEMYLHSCLADFTKKYGEDFKKRCLEECDEEDLKGDLLKEMIMLFKNEEGVWT